MDDAEGSAPLEVRLVTCAGGIVMRAVAWSNTFANSHAAEISALSACIGYTNETMSLYNLQYSIADRLLARMWAVNVPSHKEQILIHSRG